MKNYIIPLIIGLSFGAVAQAQTAVEKKTTNTSAVLEFPDGTTKGIILPAVETMPTSPANGTFLFDKTAQIVKMYQNGVWVNLSDVGNAAGVVPYSGTVDNAKQTIMGAKSTSADGVLVLEATNKALILPKVANPHLTVKGPYPGMMCYDTVRQALAVFDGKVWNYWK